MEALKFGPDELDKVYFDMVDRFKIGPGIHVSWLNEEAGARARDMYRSRQCETRLECFFLCDASRRQHHDWQCDS